ncbi:MAG: MgtC/SapB family protein [bacterium]
MTESFSHILLIVAQLLLAALLGMVISFRRRIDKYQLNMLQAHVLLTVAGAMFMIIIGDVIARAVGLLGAASVIRYRYSIRNPRDATTLILSLGVGMACGTRLFELAILAAFFTLLLTALLDRIPEMTRNRLIGREHVKRVRVVTRDFPLADKQFRALMATSGLEPTLAGFQQRVSKTRGNLIEAIYFVHVPEAVPLAELLARLDPQVAEEFGFEDLIPERE